MKADGSAHTGSRRSPGGYEVPGESQCAYPGAGVCGGVVQGFDYIMAGGQLIYGWCGMRACSRNGEDMHVRYCVRPHVSIRARVCTCSGLCS